MAALSHVILGAAMDMPADGFEYAGTLADLEAEGRLVLHGRHRPILVLLDGERPVALDNRCPHMGFPLDRGTVEDGVLTCHWHHARFDIASGCTFDLWADDVPACPVEVRGGEVWVKPSFEEDDPAAHWWAKLDDGLAHSLGLVVAKSVHGLLAAGVAPAEIVRHAALFGTANRDGWSSGLTILTSLGRLAHRLEGDDVHAALFQGARRVASDCAGEAPRRARSALASVPDLPTLERWFRRWVAVRHREGAERTLLTAIAAGAAPTELAGLLFAAETDRAFADGGHSLDFANKAFECLDLVGWEHAAEVLPSVVDGMVTARPAAESTAWRQPVDLIALLETTFAELPGVFAKAGPGPWAGHAALGESLLADDAAAVIEALTRAITEGARPTDLSRALAYAAGLRLARFGTANEQSDWETAHHTFTYCNALDAALMRIGDAPSGAAGYPEAVRGVFHGAMAVYLNRYLNVPPARLPGERGDDLSDLPEDADALRGALLDAFDRPRSVDEAARLAAGYLALGHPSSGLIATLGHQLLREDSGFHAYQILEAAVRQLEAWEGSAEGRRILIGAVRYLAAHAPTQRAVAQTADIARRLMQGGQVHEEAAGRAS